VLNAEEVSSAPCCSFPLTRKEAVHAARRDPATRVDDLDALLDRHIRIYCEKRNNPAVGKSGW
jgi:hypothetical protein